MKSPDQFGKLVKLTLLFDRLGYYFIIIRGNIKNIYNVHLQNVTYICTGMKEGRKFPFIYKYTQYR